MHATVLLHAHKVAQLSSTPLPRARAVSNSRSTTPAAVLVVRRRSSIAAQAASSSTAVSAFSASSSPSSLLTPSGPSCTRSASLIKGRRIHGGSLAHFTNKDSSSSSIVVASATPQPWPAATANVFAPGPQHYAAVVVSALKWLWATVAILMATDVARMQAFVLGATASAAAAPWTPWALRVLGANLIMAAGCAAALQRLLETGLAPKVPAGPALAMGLLGTAVFRVVHLGGYQSVYSPNFVTFSVAVAAAASLVFVALLAHLSKEKNKLNTTATTTTLSALSPASKGLPAAYSLVALFYVGIGLALQVIPGSSIAKFFAASSAASIAASPLAEALRAAIGSTLVFPASVGAWVLKDAAEKGQLAWPTSRALNLGLLLSSLARVGVIAGAVASGNVVNPEALWQLPVGVYLAVAVVAAAGLKSE